MKRDLGAVTMNAGAHEEQPEQGVDDEPEDAKGPLALALALASAER
jgi:hypothetical protein